MTLHYHKETFCFVNCLFRRELVNAILRSGNGSTSTHVLGFTKVVTVASAFDPTDVVNSIEIGDIMDDGGVSKVAKDIVKVGIAMPSNLELPL